MTGLQNLTNSCYINCVLQCLSHCAPLKDYFVRGLFVDEINAQNPLGTNGAITTAFARVLRQLWEHDNPLVVPASFKSVLSRFKKQFANCEQQDSQELLNILVDSLHEDLNRVKIKPLVPSKEYNDVSTEHAEQLAS